MVHVQAHEYQNEKAYQKQRGVSIIPGARGHNKRNHQTKPRWIKKVGFGFPIPIAAVEGTYIDNKCPFTSKVSIRGRILKGLIISKKMKNTIVIRRHYLHFIPKYNRFEKRHSNITAHCSPVFDCKVGDIATVGECRPLAKTVSFNVIHTEAKDVFSNVKKHFVMF